MTIKEAYAKVKKLPSRNVLVDCLDIGEQWAFMFSENTLPHGDHIIGGGYDAVHKISGSVTTIPANPSNWGIFAKGKRMDIRQFG